VDVRQLESAAPPQAPFAFYDGLACGVVVQNADGRVTYANAAAAALLGVSHDQILGHARVEPGWQALRQDGTALPRSEFPAVVALHTGQPQRGVTIGLSSPTGRLHWLQVDAVPTQDRNGMTGVVASFTDITARVKTEALLNRAYEALASGVVVLDGEGHVLTANVAASEILGIEQEKLEKATGTSPGWDLQRANGDPLPLEERPGAVALRTRRPVRSDHLRIKRPDATLRHMQVDAVPFRDATGSVERVVVSYVDVSERVPVEEERDRLFALSQDPMCVSRVGGHFVRVNAAFTSVLGWSEEELLSRPIVDFIHPDDRTAALAEASQQWAGKTVYQFENRYLHKDGSVRWLSWNATPVVADGLSYAVARDVTEQRRAAESLRASEERFRQVEAHAPIGLAMVALEGRWLRVNPALCAILGYSEQELLARTYQDVTHPDDLEKDMALKQRVIAGEIHTFQLEKRYVRKDGSAVWALLAVSLVRDESGMPQYFISQIKDIDERKRAEAELLESEAHYRFLAENSTDMISRNTPEGRYIYVSPSCAKLLGYAPEELLRAEAYVRFHPDDVPSVRIAHQALLDGENESSATYRIRRKDGHYIWFETRCRAIRDPQTAALLEIQSASREVTERVQAEEERRATEGRYRQLVELAQEGIWQVDTNQRTTYVNSRMAEMLGYAPKDMLGRPFMDFMDERGRALATETQALFPLGHAEPREYVFVRKDQTSLWALLTTALLSDASGRQVGAFATVTDITTRKHEEERLRHVALHDTLTGLPNRVLFTDRVNQARIAAKRRPTPLAVLLLDLDRFKSVNDTLGHDVGDAVLRIVAARLRSTLRAEDTVARLGGDEFALVLPNTGKDGALAAADRILSALAEPVVLDGRAIEVGASIGIALSPDHGDEQSALLRCADVAMYQAKREHHGRAVYRALHENGVAQAPKRNRRATPVRTEALGNDSVAEPSGQRATAPREPATIGTSD
jgi:diguanylate cyclase (GGDEF)-like protein/PAS domain S-box-containing protein